MRSYKAEIDPTNNQRTALLRHAGAARWAYNWGLARKIADYEATGKRPSAIDLSQELNILKKIPQDEGGCPWMYESSKCAPQIALQNLDLAFAGFFRRCKNGSAKKGFPKFKSRKRGIGTFTLTGRFRITCRTIRLPKLGFLRLKERGYFPTDARITAATISERAGHWFVSIRTDEPERIRPTGTEILGVDVGIKSLAILSDGTTFKNPRAMKSAERKLKHLQRSLDRKKKGSQNRKKAVLKLARHHYRVSCIRKDSIHKATTAITKRAAVIGIEDLNVAGMTKNHCLAKAVCDASMSEFLRQIEYKMKWSGGTLVKVDRWYPSSKTCAACGFILDALSLKTREWTCPQCNAHHDRDVNAACNLRNMAVSSTVENACGGPGRSAPPAKQEPDGRCPLWADA
jgi:putative transposase